MAEEREQKKDKFEFDTAGEAIGYISLEQARLLAMRTARDDPGNYGRAFAGVRMVFDVAEQAEGEDYYTVTLSFRPEGDFAGEPGQEQFFIEKEGAVAHRQVLSLPRRAGRRQTLLMVTVAAILAVAVAGVAAAILLRPGPEKPGPPGPAAAITPVPAAIAAPGDSLIPTALVPAPTAAPAIAAPPPAPAPSPTPVQVRAIPPTGAPVAAPAQPSPGVGKVEVVWEYPVATAKIPWVATDAGAGMLYFTGEDGSTVHALDGRSGVEPWRFSFRPDAVTGMSLGGGCLYLGTSFPGGVVVGLDAASGKECAKAGVGDDRPMPAIGPGGELYAASPGGQVARLPPRELGGRPFWSVKVGGGIKAPPAVGPDGTVYVATSDPGSVVAVSPEGKVLWTVATGPVEASAAPAVGSIYVVTAKGDFYALEPDGRVRWSLKVGVEPVAPPAFLPDGTVFLLVQGSALVLRPDGNYGKVGGLPPIGLRRWLALASDGTAFWLTEDGTLWAVNAPAFGGTTEATKLYYDPGVTWVAAGPPGILYLGGPKGVTGLRVPFSQALAAAPPTPMPTPPPTPISTPTPVPAARATPAPATATPLPAAGPKYGGVLKIALGVEPTAGTSDSFDFFRSPSSALLAALSPAFNGLVEQRPDDPYKIGPGLAEAWELSADRTRWTFRLNKGARFHDGKPLTTHDVVATLEYILGGAAPLVKSDLARGLLKQEARDPYTFDVHLDGPRASFLPVLARGFMNIYPEELLEAGALKDPAKALLGTGPFKLRMYKKGEVVHYDKNPSYFVKGRPYLDGLQMLVIPEETTRAAALATGQIDLSLPGLGPRDLEPVKKAGLPVLEGPYLLVGTVDYHTGADPWKDERVRRAASLAIDTVSIGKELRAWNSPPNLYMPPWGKWALPSDRAPKLYDPGLAKQLVAEAGFPQGAKTQLLVGRMGGRERAAELVQAAWKSVGINAELVLVDFPVGRDLRIRGDFQAVIETLVWPIDDPDVILGSAFESKAYFNYPRYSNSEFDKLFDIQSKEPNPIKRRQLVINMQEILHKEAPRTILLWDVFRQGLSGRVQGYHLPQSPFTRVNFAEVWRRE